MMMNNSNCVVAPQGIRTEPLCEVVVNGQIVQHSNPATPQDVSTRVFDGPIRIKLPLPKGRSGSRERIRAGRWERTRMRAALAAEDEEAARSLLTISRRRSSTTTNVPLKLRFKLKKRANDSKEDVKMNIKRTRQQNEKKIKRLQQKNEKLELVERQVKRLKRRKNTNASARPNWPG